MNSVVLWQLKDTLGVLLLDNRLYIYHNLFGRPCTSGKSHVSFDILEFMWKWKRKSYFFRNAQYKKTLSKIGFWVNGKQKGFGAFFKAIIVYGLVVDLDFII